MMHGEYMKGFSYFIPKYLLEQIEARRQVSGRSRNGEVRYLLEVGLQYVGDADFVLKLPEWGDAWVRTIGRFDLEPFSTIEDRAETYHRSTGKELVRLVAFAIEETARRDLQIIEAMMSRQDPSRLSPSQTATT